MTALVKTAHPLVLQVHRESRKQRLEPFGTSLECRTRKATMPISIQYRQ